MMTEEHGKQVVILGAARQGLALARYFIEQGVQVTITDRKDEEELIVVMEQFQEGDLQWALGGHPLELLDNADLVALSGGIPLDIPFVREADGRGITLTNDSQIFLELAPCPVAGITGSAGKTTTTLLVGKMAAAALGEESTWVGGNIGNPLISDLHHMKKDHLAVAELSSFQLEQMISSPEIACILNITPNHLDRHGTMEAYTAAKSRILKYQTADDLAVLNSDDPGSWGLRDQVQGGLISFGRQDPGEGAVGAFLKADQICFRRNSDVQELLSVSSIQLRGEHNLMNVLAACAIASAADLSVDAIRQGAVSLEGVEHRLEFVRSWGGADWYNDSIATAPERSIAAIESFEEPLVLLAGGRDKNLPWEEFADLVVDQVRAVILFGEAAGLIEDSLLAASGGRDGKILIRKCDGLQAAVQETAGIIAEGDVVLLSPGGTSFDEFIDFAERGEMFRKWVNKLS